MSKLNGDYSKIRSAAIRIHSTGMVITLPRPARHHTILHALFDMGVPELKTADHTQGFIAGNGEFVDRHHAARLLGREGQLFSEDVW